MATKTVDLRGMSDEQLGLTLKDVEKHLFQLRFQSATDRLETPSEIRKARRDIARMKTIQRERELGKLADLRSRSTGDTNHHARRPGERRMSRASASLIGRPSGSSDSMLRRQPRPSQQPRRGAVSNGRHDSDNRSPSENHRPPRRRGDRHPRQDGQDAPRRGRAAGPPRRSTASSSSGGPSATSTTRRTSRTWATRSRSSKAGRCRSSSAGSLCGS